MSNKKKTSNIEVEKVQEEEVALTTETEASEQSETKNKAGRSQDRSAIAHTELPKTVESLSVRELIKEVIIRAASGKVRQHFFHDKNHDFDETCESVVDTLLELAYAGRADDEIVTTMKNSRSRNAATFYVDAYQVPTNIGLYELLNLGLVYTTDKMMSRRMPVGELTSNYEARQDKKVLSPNALTDAFRLMEITANNGWQFGALTKPSLLISQLAFLGGNDEQGFYIVEGQGDKLNPQVILASGLCFDGPEFTLKSFYPDEYMFNDSYTELVNALAVDNKEPGQNNSNTRNRNEADLGAGREEITKPGTEQGADS